MDTISQDIVNSVKLLFDCSNHHLNTKIVEALGDSDEAFILTKIFDLCDRNRKLCSKKHYKEDRYWTCNTYGELVEELPWIIERTLRYKIRKLEDKGAVISKQFNIKRGDSTKWYAINHEGIARLLGELTSTSVNDV